MANDQIVQIYQRRPAQPSSVQYDRVVLDHLQRERGRLKVRSELGIELHIFLERGKTLAIGELLEGDDGRLFEIEGAAEDVVRAVSDSWEVFARACYHLGNRHVKLQVGGCWLLLTPDSVLEQMLVQLGLTVSHEKLVFEPEAGAYAGGGHGHNHD